MKDSTPASDWPRAQLQEVGHRFHHLLALRAALASFRITLQALGPAVQEPEGRRQALASWRPCQERLDRLLDRATEGQDWAYQMRLLRQDVEDTLLDEVYHPAALADLTEAFDQACEVLLLRLDRDLGEAIQAITAERGRVG